MPHVYIALLFGLLFTSVPAAAHSGTANRLPWEICETATLGDTCEFVDHHDMVNRGTCRSSGGALTCVRHKPLVHVDDHRIDSPVGASLVTAAGTVGGLLLIGAVAGRLYSTPGE